MRVWIKPNGTELTINAESEDIAREMGWKPKEDVQKADQKSYAAMLDVVNTEIPRRRGRPPTLRE